MLKRSKKLNFEHTLKHKKAIIGLLIIIIVVILYPLVYQHTRTAKRERELEQSIRQINSQQETLNKQQNLNSEQQKTIEELNKQKQELEKQLQAKKNAAIVYASEAPRATQSSQINCGDNIYKQYIYKHESGCRTTAINSIGCRGIGQACPGSKLPCGADFDCQDRFFSNYAIQRYGSWQNAYNFWIKNHWW